MPTVHPSAFVHPHATLADDVFVGPNCVIDSPDVRVGPGTRLIASVHLTGVVTLGVANTLYPHVALGFEPQDRKFDPARATGGVLVGDRNVLREGVTIHRATGSRPTRVGNDNLLMCNAHLGHDVELADHCTLANGTLVAGHVTIQPHAVTGGNAVVHQFCRLGRLSMLSGVAGVGQDLPPFCTAYSTRSVGSLNIVGLRRAGYRDHIPHLKRAFELLYLSRHTTSVAADLIDRELGHDPLCAELASFLRSTRRGITPYVRPAEAAADVLAEA
jgi:UDP-N-acetylglucosamine acyltransferase